MIHWVTPAMIVGAISLVILAVALFALYGRHLAGRWRTAYVITATLALYLNVFVLVIQLFTKVPSPFQPMDGAPPGGPVFAAVQAVVLGQFLFFGWKAVKRFHPAQA